MKGFDAESAEPIKQALRAARPPSQPEARFIRASFSPDTEKPEPVPAPTTIRATAQPPSQPEITPEPPEEGAKSRRKGSTVLKGDPGVRGLPGAMDALGVGQGPWGFDDDGPNKPEGSDRVSVPTPYQSGGRAEDKHSPSGRSHLPNLSDAATEEGVQKRLHGRGSLAELFGIDPERIKHIPERKLNTLLVQIMEAKPTSSTYNMDVRNKIYEVIGYDDLELAVYLDEELSRMIHESKHAGIYKYLPTENLVQIYKDKTGKSIVKTIADLAAGEISGVGKALSYLKLGSDEQIDTLVYEFDKRGVIDVPDWFVRQMEWKRGLGPADFR